MLTTTIGAFPKPDYVPITDWFTNSDGDYTSAYLNQLAEAGEQATELLDRATAEAVRDQVDAGVDIPTDGEIRREDYIHYQCRHLGGIDFTNLAPVKSRGTTDTIVPTFTGPVTAGESPLPRDFAVARHPDAALEWGIDNLAKCFAGIGTAVTKVVHVCCGYPRRLDDGDYVKAPQSWYLQLAKALNDLPLDEMSLEDAHRHNDIESLLPRFTSTKVILGAVAIAKSRVEPVAGIRTRLLAAADCGLGYLDRDLAITKLRNLAEAAHSIGV